MERGKSSSGRGGKNKAPQFPANLYALGSKPNNEFKLRPILPKVAGKPTTDRDRKRDSASLPTVVPSKKPKTTGTGFLNRPSTSGSSPTPSSSSTASSDAWEAAALEVDPSDFVIQVLDAADAEDNEKVVGLICGAIKLLKTQRIKPDLIVYESLAYLAKIRASLFTNDSIVNALCSLLRKENVYAFKTKGNTCVLTLVVSILTSAFLNIKKWPELFVKVYLEDAGGERAWVDNDFCKGFVDNIILGLNTKPITVSVDAAGKIDQPDDDLTPVANKPSVSDTMRSEPIPVIARFRSNRDAVETLVLDCVKEQLTRKQSSDLINRNFLRMLSSLCGVTEVRLLIAPRLEAWLQNPKLMRSAQELLMSVCVNCAAQTIKDVEVISSLIKMRLKSKTLCNYYLACIKELVSTYPENLSTVLKHTIYNELSTSRNPNNMSMLGVIFQLDPEPSALGLAEIFQELLLTRDDYLRPLRALIREMARVLRMELRLPTFCKGLMNNVEPLSKESDSIRAFAATADLISLSIFLAVMPHAKSDKKDSQQIERMQNIIANIQKDTVWWLQETAMTAYRPSAQDFLHALHKILLLEPAEHYYKIDMWPPEPDRPLFMRMSTEVPVLEETLLTILALGLSKDHPLNPVEALDIADQLVRRAAAIQNPLIPVLKMDKIKVLDLVFNLCAYRHPENIDLPTGYSPPTLAISALYWKGWTMLLILSAHNPVKIGTIAWEKYPTLRILMEMCITSHFVFPQGYDELQILALEKQNILEFESHLAAASTKMEITEQSSLLLSQLVTMDPFGPARRPPPPTLELIKSLNTSLRLGHLLCRSRNPDFLLDIIHRQGASQSMPWLADLVHNSEGALNHLPVQCLCEFLLSSSHKQEGKYQQLLSHLQNILTDAQQDHNNACEVLDYFLKRLSSPSNRTLAITGLKLVISPLIDEEGMDTTNGTGNNVAGNVGHKDDTSWLTKQLPLLPHFQIARPQIVCSLRSACQVENDPNLVTAYLCFLSSHANGDLTEMTDLVLDMAQLIVERSTIMGAILPNTDQPNPALDAFVSIFYNYLTKAREPRREDYTWSESQDQVLVTWSTGEQCTVHILVVHAIVILLTYGASAVSEPTYYNHLLDTWFPKELDKAPKGFLVDTCEEALLIPDWLKLRMIRSHVPRLVEAALTDLDISQLILFIQSFGIPIASMSKLLATLDAAVLTDKSAVGEAVIDKSYMVQLVEVQHRRGAIGGETFTRVLDLMETPKCQSMDVDAEPHEEDVPQKKQRIKQKFLDEKEGVNAIEQLFSPQVDVASSQHLREIFQRLQRTLVYEMSTKEEGPKGSNFLKELMRSFLIHATTDKEFINAVMSRPQYACPLFRLLTTLNPNSPSLTLLANTLLEENIQLPRAKPLINILSQYVQCNDSVVKMKPVKVIKEEEADALTDAIGKLLLDPGPATGLLVDKLVRLEPEILGSSVDLQMKLLFSANKSKSLQFRPYLLTLLTHHASWKTLSQCVSILMNPDALQQFEPTLVLDFLRALTCNPKLWQGREKHTPKHYVQEDVLHLSITQLICMTDYIVAEAERIACANPDGGTPSNDKIVLKINLRLQLLNQCVRATDVQKITTLVKHLITRSNNADGTEKKMCKLLIVQLYLKIPSVINQLGHEVLDDLLNKYSSLAVRCSSVMDVLSHTLLTALSSSSNAKDWPKRSQELELTVRKMAATHPILVLRQLPLIASSLRGRVDLEWNVFKFRNHLLFFQQISNLLDLLQPSIFLSEHAQYLHKTLDSFMDLFQNHGKDCAAAQAIGGLVTNFVSFVQGYVSFSANIAQTYLQTKAEMISDLQTDYPALGRLCVVIAGLRGGLEVIVTPDNPVEQPNPQWEDKVAQLSKDDPMSTLMFLDYGSTKHPALLRPLLPPLCAFLRSRVQQVRISAHIMVVRYLRHNPRAASEVLPAYIACLDSRQPEVVNSALDKLPEVVVCSQELALPLLQKVFSLGVRCNINTISCISKTIAMLNLQSAC